MGPRLAILVESFELGAQGSGGEGRGKQQASNGFRARRAYWLTVFTAPWMFLLSELHPRFKV